MNIGFGQRNGLRSAKARRWGEPESRSVDLTLRRAGGLGRYDKRRSERRAEIAERGPGVQAKSKLQSCLFLIIAGMEEEANTC